MKDIIAFVLAGGRGERLMPLTRDRAKPAVPFGGIYRLIDFTLSNCINSEIYKIFIVPQYKFLSLARHLRDGWNIFRPELGHFLTILSPEQREDLSWYKGTADAVYRNFYYLEREKVNNILILSGDHIYSMDYRKMLSFHREKDADLTISVFQVPISRASQFGIIEIDQNYKVIGFEEKPAKPKPIPNNPKKAFISMGIYLFKIEILKEILYDDAKKDDSSHDFGKNIIPSMVYGPYKVFAYPFKDENRSYYGQDEQEDYWRDVGTISSYWQAHMDLVAVSPIFNLYNETWPIRTFHEIHPPAKTVFSKESSKDRERMGIALDSLISPGCIISGGRVNNSVLSYSVRINSFSEVDQSILFSYVEVGRYCKIRRTIIDKGVKLPPKITIGYDREEDEKRGFFVKDFEPPFVSENNWITVVPKEYKF
ncbi:MAG: glucose-1-phosphate adenylyltransferase [Deltaproteobacteria bacterium]|nr:glucose-1-phosphate adenylyltransferase [Deltaproteobacteria bacterium]RLA89114.1 MAG: glucose-1-phosphate adenylyltransferase [Deltaproteobacteria bacterium]